MPKTKAEHKSAIYEEIRSGGAWPLFRPKKYAAANGLSSTTVYKYLSELATEGKIYKYYYGRIINYTCVKQ